MPLLYETVYPKPAAQAPTREALLYLKNVLLPNLGLMKKEAGTPVDFSQGREIDLQMYTFRDDIIGLYAYQGVPATIDRETRNAFVNGNLADILNQAAGQGMNIEYIRITWNETAQGNNYYITDLVVGVVAKVTRDYNTGPAYLIDALKAIGWYNQLISKLSMPWQSWLLLQTTRTTPFTRWVWEAKSDVWGKSAGIGQPIPDPPPVSEVRGHFVDDGNVDEAIGAFVRRALDDGYTLTILSYKVDICYERVYYVYQGMHGYSYRTHTRLSIDFTTGTELGAMAKRSFAIPLFVWAAVAIAIIILAAGGFFALQNLTTETETWQKWGWVQNPETGDWEYKVVEEGTKTGPPEYWGTVLTAIGVVSVLALTVIIVPRLLPGPKSQQPPPPPPR